MSRLRALYLTDRFDAPFRYRCVHACEQLRASGAFANLLHLDDPVVLAELDRYAVVVLFRLPWSQRLALVVERARRARIPIVFDLDDLVFDPACAELMPLRRRHGDALWQDTYGRQLAGLKATFEACDLMVGSTPALVAHAERLGKPARVHKNVVPERYLAVSKRLERVRPMLRRGPTLGYFSGSDTHDDDFASIATTLRRVLELRPGARLVLCGYIQLPDALRGLDARLVRLPYLSWRVYPWALGACHVNLAPLALRNAFTDAKSALKFFEAGALAVPTAASPTAELANAIENGVSGWLPSDEREWTEALLEGLRDEVSLRVGAAARRAVSREHSAESQRGRLAAILQSIAIDPSGVEPAARRIDFEERDTGAFARPRSATRRGAELARVFQALGARRPSGIDQGALERWLDARLGDTLGQRAEGVGLFVGDLDAAGWKPNAALAETGRVPGERAAIAAEAHWSSPAFSLETGGARYLVVRMRAETPGARAEAKLDWLVGRDQALNERPSVAIPLIADGVDRTYLVDLHRHDAGASWKRLRGALRLRFHPLDRCGSLRVAALALLADGWQPPEVVAPRAPPAIELPAKKRARRRTLKKALQRIRPGERLRVTSERGPGDLRAALAETEGGAAFVVERVATIAGGSSLAVLLGAKPASLPAIDIVLPVYNARRQTIRCIESVLRHARGDFRLVVIDDASSDPELWPGLAKLARKSTRVLLLRNPKNLGFVATVNRGIEHAGSRDVLVLNSDTEVFARFLERLAAAARAEPSTGIVCPLSNNATICSVPEFCRPNPLPAGLSGKKMAALVRRTSLRRRPELVTPVGFCMYLRADMLKDVGKLDEARFGRGFGEENDLGERAKARGWSIRLADDVYVLHEGKASFGEEGHALEAKNARVLAAKHPSYHAAVSNFIRTNPLADVHADLALHLRRKSHDSEATVLELLHASPFASELGGTEHVVRDLVRGLGFYRVVIAYPIAGGIEIAEVIEGDLDAPLRYFMKLERAVSRFAHEHAEAEAAFQRILELFQVGAVHIHHLFHWPLAIERTLRRSKLPYVVTVHDHYSVCPSVNLLDVRDASRCCPDSIGDDERTRGCQSALYAALGETAPEDPVRFLRDHRTLFSTLLSGAKRVVFPSPSAARITSSLHELRKKRQEVVPHGYDPPRLCRQQARRRGPLRVALLGEVAYAAKGSEGYLAVMRACHTADVEFHIFGRTERFGFDAKLSGTGAPIVRHGAYRRDQVTELLSSAEVDVGLLLPVSPETFSLTLSELVGAGVPVVATRQGALADRLDGSAYGVLVDDATEAGAVLLDLASNAERLEKLRSAARSFRHPTLEGFRSAHRDLYRECLERAPDSARRRLRPRELRALSALRRPGPPMPSHFATTKPAARHTESWWYPWAERLKPHVPELLRAAVRRRLAGDGLVPLARFRLPGRGARIGSELRIVRHYFGTTLLESLGDDPYILLEPEPLPSERVRAIRFNLWCSQASAAFAQIYWKHAGDTAFAEAKSVVVPLDTRAAAWQEYVVRLDALADARTWYAGREIVELRFDPIAAPGLLGLGELALCGFAQSAPTLTTRS